MGLFLRWWVIYSTISVAVVVLVLIWVKHTNVTVFMGKLYRDEGIRKNMVVESEMAGPKSHLKVIQLNSILEHTEKLLELVVCTMKISGKPFHWVEEIKLKSKSQQTL